MGDTQQSRERTPTFFDLSEETFADQRGWVINPLRAASLCGIAPNNVHLVSIEPGFSRGNHYHPEASEWLLVFGSPAYLHWCSVGKDKQPGCPVSIQEITKPTFLSIPPYIAHTISNKSDDTVFLLAFNDAPEKNITTISCPLDTDSIHRA